LKDAEILKDWATIMRRSRDLQNKKKKRKSKKNKNTKITSPFFIQDSFLQRTKKAELFMNKNQGFDLRSNPHDRSWEVSVL